MARTLPDRHASAAEQRRTDTHVCRAVSDRCLQVSRHPRRDHVRLWLRPAYAGSDDGEPPECLVGVGAQRGDRHQAAEPEPVRGGDGGGEGLRLVRAHTPRPVASASRETWTSATRGRSRNCAARPSAVTSVSRSTECTTSAYVTTELTLLRWSWPTKCHRRSRSAQLACLSRASWSRFSPTSPTPSSARIRTSLAGQVFVTATRATSSGGRPAETQAAAIRARVAARLAASSSRRLKATSRPLRRTDR